MEYRIKHTTLYQYSEPVTLCHNRAILKPKDGMGQKCHKFTLRIDPEPAIMESHKDAFGNTVHYFEIHEPHKQLEITATSQLTRTPVLLPPMAMENSPAWESVRSQFDAGDGNEDMVHVALYRMPSPMIPALPALAELTDPIFTPGRPILEATMAFTQAIHEGFKYDPEATTIATPITAVLAQRAGVCQDFAHIAVGALRQIGLAARYVSGYLETLPPPGQPRLEGADASHAWFSLYLPGLGWVDFDPTNGCMTESHHLVVAVGRDYADVPPVKGVVMGGWEHTLEVAVDVVRQTV
ncbi:transglutaminase, N-terminal domain protein [Magnetococcus marinus MC-1]|uniref:Transglutaminase, N-terminal domain protein n=1 Tax=Magnetococcus marinus (strain ATCC BAA-1437 / JCM 17883 / MC-1) TaxID=156889 RepID=A0L4M8_MAGMM|nr:transglutaminase family protein [Magnetococcus marinus]ABK42921.1 transglutaminase, N-terminal domain protein [Magnetococcus marinus MC-1]